MYPITFSFVIQALLVFTCEVQTSNAGESQRNLLREGFQKVLMNDSEQLLILQKIFLTPRQKNPNGFYLFVYVTVEGRIADDGDRFLIDDYCDGEFGVFPQNNSCVYRASMKFEVLPPAADHDSTVQDLLSTKPDIGMVLLVLDPSFQSLASMLHDSYNVTVYDLLNLYMHAENVEIMPVELRTDVRNAVYLTLSWVSFESMYNLYFRVA
jgi:hypothetical protein